MKFCSICDNMYYLKLEENTPNELVYYCRNCGQTDSELDNNVCIISTSDKANNSFDNVVNEFTKLDPTLPRITNISCPNNTCVSHTNPLINEIIYIRYDNINMKFLYLCSNCDFVWKAN